MTGYFLLLSADATEAAEALNNLNSEIANFGPLEFIFSGFGLLIIAALFVVPLFIATIPANIAKKKGRNFAGYYLFAYFAFIPALIVTLVQKPVPKDDKQAKTMRSIASGK